MKNNSVTILEATEVINYQWTKSKRKESLEEENSKEILRDLIHHNEKFKLNNDNLEKRILEAELEKVQTIRAKTQLMENINIELDINQISIIEENSGLLIVDSQINNTVLTLKDLEVQNEKYNQLKDNCDKLVQEININKSYNDQYISIVNGEKMNLEGKLEKKRNKLRFLREGKKYQEEQHMIFKQEFGVEKENLNNTISNLENKLSELGLQTEYNDRLKRECSLANLTEGLNINWLKTSSKSDIELEENSKGLIKELLYQNKELQLNKEELEKKVSEGKQKSELINIEKSKLLENFQIELDINIMDIKQEDRIPKVDSEIMTELTIIDLEFQSLQYSEIKSHLDKLADEMTINMAQNDQNIIGINSEKQHLEDKLDKKRNKLKYLKEGQKDLEVQHILFQEEFIIEKENLNKVITEHEKKLGELQIQAKSIKKLETQKREFISLSINIEEISVNWAKNIPSESLLEAENKAELIKDLIYKNERLKMEKAEDEVASDIREEELNNIKFLGNIEIELDINTINIPRCNKLERINY